MQKPVSNADRCPKPNTTVMPLDAACNITTVKMTPREEFYKEKSRPVKTIYYPLNLEPTLTGSIQFVNPRTIQVFYPFAEKPFLSHALSSGQFPAFYRYLEVKEIHMAYGVIQKIITKMKVWTYGAGMIDKSYQKPKLNSSFNLEYGKD